MEDKKIINFAPTGTQTTKENSLAPLEINKIIEEVHHAYELGISIVHIHARDNSLEFKNTYKKEYYSDIIEGIKKNCRDLIICVSLTGRNFPELEKRSEVLQLCPDMGSLTMSSLNFPTGASVNEPGMILSLINEMEKYGVMPEIECFDAGMINYANHLISKGILKQPHYINVILGNIFNAQSDIHSISSIKSIIPKNAKVCFGGIGKQQLRSNIYGLLEADGIRIGLEDNLYLSGKEKATNIQLLKRIKGVMHEMGIEILQSKELRELGYGNKFNNIR